MARVGLGLSALLFLLLLHWPKAVSIGLSLKRIRTQESQLKEARNWQVITRRLGAQIQQIRTRLDRIEENRPEAQMQSGILSFVHKASKEAGLTLSFIKPGAKNELPEYSETLIVLGLVGRYHAVGRFLYLLESSENAITLQWMELATKGLIEETLNVELTLSFYQLNMNAVRASRS